MLINAKLLVGHLQLTPPNEQEHEQEHEQEQEQESDDDADKEHAQGDDKDSRSPIISLSRRRLDMRSVFLAPALGGYLTED